MATAIVQQRNQACLDSCAECEQACESCNYNCCAENPRMILCARLCLDFAMISAACATLLARDSGWAGQLCRLCTEVCQTCAVECEKYDMDYCRECAAACRRCAEQCQAMTSASA